MSLSEGAAVRGLSDAQVKTITDELAEAARTGTRIATPSRRFPAMTVGDSYAVQRLWRDRRKVEGGRVAGFKIGLTSVAMQQAFGLDEPDYGRIVETGVSGAVLGHPAASAAWMANRFAERGEEITAGALLLSGSFTRPVAVTAGDSVVAEYQGMGAVRVQYT